jgi:hypothetical protein
MSLSTLNAQVLIRNTSTQKSKEIDFGRTIYFKLFSDSVLGIELIKEMGILTTTSDSNFIFSDGMEVPIGDIKYLEIESKKTKKLARFDKSISSFWDCIFDCWNNNGYY